MRCTRCGTAPYRVNPINARTQQRTCRLGPTPAPRV
jgi:hypothetical protein